MLLLPVVAAVAHRSCYTQESMGVSISTSALMMYLKTQHCC